MLADAPMKLKIKKGDTVIVIAGNDKGKTGRVIAVYPKKMRVLVEGVNVRKKAHAPIAGISARGHHLKGDAHSLLERDARRT